MIEIINVTVFESYSFITSPDVMKLCDTHIDVGSWLVGWLGSVIFKEISVSAQKSLRVLHLIERVDFWSVLSFVSCRL